MLTRAGLALASGILLSLAFEPVAWPVVMPVAVAGFVLTVRGLPVRRAWWVGLAFGVGFYFVHIWWMRAVATGAWLGLAGIEAVFYGLLGMAVAALVRLPWWPLWVSAAWVTMEVWRSGWPFSGMPWGRLAFAVVDTPVAPALPYVGMVGVSFLLALTAMLLAWLAVEVARGRAGTRRLTALTGLVAVVGLTLVPVALPWQPAATGEVSVAAVQGDVPGPGNSVLWDYQQVTENHAQATVDLAADVAAGDVEQPAFVVWPENSTAVDPFRDPQTHAQIERAVAAIGVPVLVGGIVDGGPGEVLNQGIVWDPETGAGDRYTKRHPVPYGEYIPFRDLMDFQFGQLTQIQRDMLGGTRRTPLDVAGVRVADAICFDVAYDDGIYDQVTRGGELLTVQTSNATFIFTDQIDQQFAISRLRAIETGRWTVVSSTNGLSGIIAPDGTVTASADPRTTAVMLDQVDLVSAVPPGLRIGPWVGRGSAAVTLVALVVCAVAYRRGDRSRVTPRGERAAPEQPVGAGSV